MKISYENKKKKISVNHGCNEYSGKEFPS